MALRRRYKRPTKFMSISRKRLISETRGQWESPRASASRHLFPSLRQMTLCKRTPRASLWTPVGTPPSAPGTGTSSRTSETRSSEKSRILKKAYHKYIDRYNNQSNKYFPRRNLKTVLNISIWFSGRLEKRRMTEKWTSWFMSTTPNMSSGEI